MSALRAIVVEDQAIIAESLAEVLRGLGHEVCGVAGDVRGAADLLRECNPDLITLDIDLGEGGEGLGVATVVQATGIVPIVFVTGLADEDQRERVRAIEGSSLLVKPFTAAELRTAIALAVERVGRTQSASL